MSESKSKVLFLKLAGADDGFAQELITGLDGSDATHEVQDLSTGDYDAVLDRLGPGVLPVVLRPAIPGAGAA